MDLHVIRRAPLADGPGRGALVVMVHGAMDRGSSFSRVWRQLPDFELESYDRRGYAGSIGLPATTDFADQCDDLVSVLDGRRAVVVGHSFGGTVALATAAVHPDLVAAVVVYEPAARRSADPATGAVAASAADTEGAELSPEDRAEAFMRRMVGSRIWDRLPEATRALRRAEGPTLVADLGALRGNLFDPARVTVPVIVGYGTHSPPSAAERARALVASLPRASLAAVPGAQHGVHLGDPRALAAMVREATMRSGPPRGPA